MKESEKEEEKEESEKEEEKEKKKRIRKRRGEGEKKNQKKKRRRRNIIKREKSELKEKLKESRNIDLPDDMFKPLYNTQYQWKDYEKEICSKCLKFVPTVRRHDEAKKLETFYVRSGRRLRLQSFFIELKKNKQWLKIKLSGNKVMK